MTPIDTTHFAEFWGDIIYYRLRYRDHLNQVCEEWQRYPVWHYWNENTKKWEDVGSGFCSRRLKEI